MYVFTAVVLTVSSACLLTFILIWLTGDLFSFIYYAATQHLGGVFVAATLFGVLMHYATRRFVRRRYLPTILSSAVALAILSFFAGWMLLSSHFDDVPSITTTIAYLLNTHLP